MIDGQISTAGVVQEPIIAAFNSIPRELFVPERLSNIAYSDEDIDIGQGRFLIEPIVYAKMIQAANPCETDVVLDIGVGSGYSSAILSSLVTTVIALEHNKRQMDRATKLWAQLGACNIALIEGALTKGVPEQAPYSLIIINGAVEHVPQNIIDQMEVGGRLVAVVKKARQSVGCATLFIKSSAANIASKKLFDAATPFLKGFEPEPVFQF